MRKLCRFAWAGLTGVRRSRMVPVACAYDQARATNHPLSVGYKAFASAHRNNRSTTRNARSTPQEVPDLLPKQLLWLAIYLPSLICPELAAHIDFLKNSALTDSSDALKISESLLSYEQVLRQLIIFAETEMMIPFTEILLRR